MPFENYIISLQSMRYTLEDLRLGKVILMNSNESKCKKILKKVFGITMESYELPGMVYYHADAGFEDGCNSFDVIERDAPQIRHLPVQKSERFKI